MPSLEERLERRREVAHHQVGQQLVIINAAMFNLATALPNACMRTPCRLMRLPTLTMKMSFNIMLLGVLVLACQVRQSLLLRFHQELSKQRHRLMCISKQVITATAHPLSLWSTCCTCLVHKQQSEKDIAHTVKSARVSCCHGWRGHVIHIHEQYGLDLRHSMALAGTFSQI